MSAKVSSTLSFDVPGDGETPGPSLPLTNGRQSSEDRRNLPVPGIEGQGFGDEGPSFYRIIPGFMYKGSDVPHYNATGRTSVYREKFENKNRDLLSQNLAHGKCHTKHKWLWVMGWEVGGL